MERILKHHSDHLGSTSLITDLDGNVAQHVEYIPFGEVFIEERNSTWNTPYKFNAKELDEETGLYYYGARYYDPRTSVWLGADPLQEKYPGVSTYAYCKNNPVNRIDIDGRDDFFYNQKGEEINCKETRKPNNFYLEHVEGNKTIDGKTYYQGASKESFFGDRGNEKIEMFEKVDAETMSSDEKIVATVDEHTRKGETEFGFLKNSPEGKHYDYKNTVLGPIQENPIDNTKTAYLYHGILLNRNEAGNIYWGATAEKLGFGIPGTLLGVQIYSLINEGKFDEKSEQNAIVRGMLIYDIYGKKK